MSKQVVLSVIEGATAVITLNRPEQRNAWNAALADALFDALEQADADDHVRAIIVTGAGTVFCAGSELGTAPEPGAAARKPQPRRRRKMVWEIKKPVIAAINGHAVGVGMTLPLQCDLRIAAEDAKLGFVFVRRGRVPELASSWILPRLVGIARAADLLLTGRVITGREAAEMGVVNEAVPRDAVLDRAREIARDIATNTSPAAVAWTKRLMWEHLSVPDPARAAAREIKAFYHSGKQPDAVEGARSFFEKREPKWTSTPSAPMPDIDIPDA